MEISSDDFRTHGRTYVVISAPLRKYKPRVMSYAGVIISFFSSSPPAKNAIGYPEALC